MLRTARALTVLFAAVILTLTAAPTAGARPTNVAWTQDHPAKVGEPVTYTGTGTCDTKTCRPQFRAFGPGYSRTGTILCECSTLTVTWPTAGNRLIQFRLTNSLGTNGFTTYDAYTVVAP